MNISMSSISLLLLWFLATVISFCHGNSHVGCIESERKTLLRFKQDIVDPSNLLASWAGDGDCCRWARVNCDNLTGHVRELRLGNPNLQLSGKLNSCLLNLKHLKFWNLSNNNFQGAQIPSFLGSMRSLEYLDLSRAGFSGTIPYQLGNLTNLHYLDLQDSEFMWKIYADNLQWLSGLTSLTHLDLSNLDLKKTSDWLQATSTLASLSTLRLSGCNLHYLPPVSIVNFSSLTILDLSYNFIENSLLPSWLAGLNNLVSLRLKFNFFHGPIPDGLQNMTYLRDLNLYGNNLNSSIPDWLYSFGHLEFLNLGNNQFQGTISNFIGNLTSVVSLDLSSNKLEGGIPTSLGKLCNLKSIVLYYVPLTQNISSILDILSAGCASNLLESLDLQLSQLSGHLTDQLGKFKSLVELDLSMNSISGPMPNALGELLSLRHLSLSFNKLNGTLPPSLGQLANLEDLWISANLFEGVVSEVHFANLTRLKVLQASGNRPMLNVSLDWIPPFQLQTLGLASWHLGPQFPPWIQTQKHLELLYISDTKISDVIPTWFWNLSYQFAEINLSNNQIRGTIPNLTRFGSMFHSGVIDLSSNYFEGSLPCISSTVSVLDLSNNSLSGSISQFLCDRMNESKLLEVLNLRDNLLSGEIPDCWRQWQYLLSINLGNNNFTSDIPNSLGNLSYLRSLHLEKNIVSGGIPLSLENCTQLETLDFAENQLSGVVPSWLGERLLNLKVIILRSNNLYASIPEELCSLTSLQVLDLSHNKLSGSMPRCINKFSAMTTMSNSSDEYRSSDPYSSGNYEDASLVVRGQIYHYVTSILKYVRSIDLSRNSFSGEIPEEVTNLITLQSLNLSHNHLIGRIPEKIGAMKSLECLDFSVNQLIGEIPSSMSGLTFLSYLNLSYNSLTGQIPSSTQLQSFDASSFLGNKLCGLPLAVNCSEIGVPPKFQGEAAQGHKEVSGFYVSMTLGFVVSFWSVFGSLVINRRWRHIYFPFSDNMRYKFEDVCRKFCTGIVVQKAISSLE